MDGFFWKSNDDTFHIFYDMFYQPNLSKKYLDKMQVGQDSNLLQTNVCIPKNIRVLYIQLVFVTQPIGKDWRLTYSCLPYYFTVGLFLINVFTRYAYIGIYISDSSLHLMQSYKYLWSFTFRDIFTCSNSVVSWRD